MTPCSAAADHQQLLSPICSALEHDSISLYVGKSNDPFDLPDPPATAVVNSALQLFAICLPLQTPKIQESILEQITSFLSASNLQRDVNRKTAMMVNIAYALLAALKVAVKETRSAPGDLRGSAVEKVIQELLHVSTAKKRATGNTNTGRCSSFFRILTSVISLGKR